MADERHDPSPNVDHEHDRDARHTHDVNMPVIVTIGVISVLLLIVIVFGTVAWYHHERQKEWEAKVLERDNPQLRELNRQAEARLHNIDQAMGRVVERYRDASAEQRGSLRAPLPTEEVVVDEPTEDDIPSEAAPDADQAEMEPR